MVKIPIAVETFSCKCLSRLSLNGNIILHFVIQMRQGKESSVQMRTSQKSRSQDFEGQGKFRGDLKNRKYSFAIQFIAWVFLYTSKQKKKNKKRQKKKRKNYLQIPLTVNWFPYDETIFLIACRWTLHIQSSAGKFWAGNKSIFRTLSKIWSMNNNESDFYSFSCQFSWMYLFIR